MRIFTRLALMMVLPVFIFTLLSFVIFFQLIDLFSNIVNYLKADLSMLEIFYLQLLYLPECIINSLSLSALFAISYTLGTLQSRNELIAIFGAGISLYRFVIPFLCLGLFLSVSYFFIQDSIAIPSKVKRADLTAELLGRTSPSSITDINLIADQHKLIISALRYEEKNNTIRDLVLYYIADDGHFEKRIEADSAVWLESQSKWRLGIAAEYRLDNMKLIEKDVSNFIIPMGGLTPDDFLQTKNTIDYMTLKEARKWIDYRRRAGLDYREQLVEFHRRIAFSFTCLIVGFLASSIGGRFKAFALLFSLGASLALGVLYYVFQMLTMLFARLGYFPAFLGAWLPLFVFTILGILLFRYAKT
ncbi:LptF/LptG family permease [Spirochaetia bacterium 38H-sp]|uniref:LptF/LptG family permease n=1 Tax=Rarispira pelagica TaxID=3141764 RepID=A0ABU9UBF8_9SPIR